MNSSIAAGEGSLEISAEVGGSLEDMQPIFDIELRGSRP
jgi:hypothetical protein